MYLRKNNDKLTIRSLDEKLTIIDTINQNVLKYINFNCVGLITNIDPTTKEIEVTSVICKEKDSKVTKIFKLLSEFPNIKLCQVDGQIVAEGSFDINKQKEELLEYEKNIKKEKEIEIKEEEYKEMENYFNNINVDDKNNNINENINENINQQTNQNNSQKKRGRKKRSV